MTRARGPSRRPARARLLAAVAGASLLAPAALAAQTSLTLYQDGRVLVRRALGQAVPRGASVRRLALGPLDPGSVFLLDSGVTVVSARYEGGVDEASVLRRAVGRELAFLTRDTRPDTVRAVLLGADPERYRLPGGAVTYTRPGALLLPAELVPVDPTLTLELRSAAPRRALGIGYFTEGASWQATYDFVLGGKTARAAGTAVIPSERLRLDSAEVQLLAGETGRAVPPPRPLLERRAEAVAMDAAAPAEQRVGEARVYTLPGRWSLVPGVTTTVALFEPVAVPYEKTLLVRGALPYWGYIPPQPEEGQLPVEVSYRFRRPHRTEFGDRPLPAGTARIYAADSVGRLQLVGEAASAHTAPGQDLRLSAGQAFDITARRIQTSYRTRRDSTAAAGVRTVAIADYRVTLDNATDSAATVEVLEERGGEWAVVSSSVPAEKLSATATRFRVRVPAKGRAVLTYRVRATW